jgi:hypothetical protein
VKTTEFIMKNGTVTGKIIKIGTVMFMAIFANLYLSSLEICVKILVYFCVFNSFPSKIS